jgi:L-ribulose-5-phosphate 4-epimerase
VTPNGEAVADIALHTLSLNPTAPPPAHLLERQYTRKHVPGAYYGNPDMTPTSG